MLPVSQAELELLEEHKQNQRLFVRMLEQLWLLVDYLGLGKLDFLATGPGNINNQFKFARCNIQQLFILLPDSVFKAVKKITSTSKFLSSNFFNSLSKVPPSAKASLYRLVSQYKPISLDSRDCLKKVRLSSLAHSIHSCYKGYDYI